MATENDSALPNDIREGIAISTVESIAGQTSSLSNMAYANNVSNTNLSQQNTVANQQSVNQVGVSVLGKAVNLVADLSPLEAVATSKLDTGNDVAEQISDLKAALQPLINPVGPPGPLPPLPPLGSSPKVVVNPAGGWTLQFTSSQLPINLVQMDDAPIKFGP